MGMRGVAIVAAMSTGCSLYFGGGTNPAGRGTDDAPPAYAGPILMPTVVGSRQAHVFGITGRLGSGPNILFDGYFMNASDRATGYVGPVFPYDPNHPTKNGIRLALDGGNAVIQTETSNHHLTPNYPDIYVCPGDACGSTTPPVLAAKYAQPDPANALMPYLLGAANGQIYALNGDTGNVLTCPETDCSAPRSIATGLPVSSFSLATGEQLFGFADAAGLVILDQPTLYVLPSGGALASIATVEGTIFGFQADATTIFWATSTAITSCPRSTASCTPSPFTAGTAIRGLHVDATNVYWIDADTIYRCPRSGCATATALASCVETSYLDTDPVLRSHQLFGDDTSLYCSQGITDQGGNATVLQLVK